MAGMSTVHEVVTAKHCGLRCLAFSLITNTCTTVTSSALSSSPAAATSGHVNVEEEVMTVADASEPMLKDFVFHLVQSLASEASAAAEVARS